MDKTKKKHSSWKNYKNYIGRKEQLKNAVLQHPEESENSIYDFMQKNINRQFWIKPYSDWKKDKK